MFSRPPASTCLALGLCALLAACSVDDGCELPGKNLLRDPEFSTVDRGRRERQWLASQHGSSRSFTWEAADGALSIRKTGAEPWFLLSQTVPPEPLRGKNLVFSAQIKLDLQPPQPHHGFKPGAGLSITARANHKLVLNSQLDHEPHMGESDWQQVSVPFTLPPNADSLRLAFLHQANGLLQVRAPSLHLDTGCSD